MIVIDACVAVKLVLNEPDSCVAQSMAGSPQDARVRVKKLGWL